MARGDVAQRGRSSETPPFRNVTSKATPGAARERLQTLFAPHVDSFNHFIDEGLGKSIAALEVQEVELNSMPRLRFWIDSVHAGKPVNATGKGIHYKADDAKPLYPSECRERAVSYRSQLHAVVMLQVGDDAPERIERRLGLMPVMLRSKLCNLRGLSPSQLVDRHEEGSEMGGFFVVCGHTSHRSPHLYLRLAQLSAHLTSSAAGERQRKGYPPSDRAAAQPSCGHHPAVLQESRRRLRPARGSPPLRAPRRFLPDNRIALTTLWRRQTTCGDT